LIGPQSYSSTRRLPFEFIEHNIDALLKKLPREVGDDFAALLPEAGESFCDASERAELDAFFRPRIENYTGGSRILAQTLERIDLCIARRKALASGLEEFLGSDVRP
jgi:alanyl aminopeptidase